MLKDLYAYMTGWSIYSKKNTASLDSDKIVGANDLKESLIPKEVTNKSEVTDFNTGIDNEQMSSDIPRLTSFDSEAKSSDAPVREKQSHKPRRVKKNCNKIFYLMLTNGAAYISNVFHGIFFAVAAHAAVKGTLTEFGVEIGGWNYLVITSIAGLALLSTICDASITNPPESARYLLNQKNSDLEEKLLKDLSPFVKKIAKTLGYINKGVLLYFIIFNAASDILPISYITSDLRVIITIAIPLVSLSTVFLYVLLSARTQEHTYEFIRRLLNKNESMLLNALKSSVKSSEVILQSLSTAMNQAIANGNIVAQVLTYMFRMPNNAAYRMLIYSGVGVGLYSSLFSRVLNVHGQFFNMEFGKIPTDILRKTSVSKIGIGFDVVMTSLRAFPAGVLIYRYSSNNKFLISIPISLILAGHSLYVRYINRFYQSALENYNIELKKSSHDENIELSSIKMFNIISEAYKTPRLQTMVKVFNIGGRVCGSLSFLGFLFYLNEALNIKTDFYTILCVHQLWGNTTLENDFSFYQDTLFNIWASIGSKMHMESTKPYYGKLRSFFWKSATNYPPAYLQNFMPSQPPRLA